MKMKRCEFLNGRRDCSGKCELENFYCYAVPVSAYKDEYKINATTFNTYTSVFQKEDGELIGQETIVQTYKGGWVIDYTIINGHKDIVSATENMEVIQP